MASDPIVDRVCKLLAANQRIPIEQITPDKTFEELSIDSLDATNLLFALEDEFKISIDDDAAKNFHSVREVADGIEKLLSETSQNILDKRG